MKITHFITHLFFAVVQGVVTSGTAEADAAKELKANVETFSEAQRRWSALLKESVEAKKAVGTAEESGEAKFSMRQNITGDSGKVYGDGVYLDSNLLDGLSDKERVQMVKARIAELGGQTFTAYDGNTPVEIKIENSRKRFKNKNDRFVQVNKDLTVKHIGQKIKQEAVVLSDEIIKASKFKESIPSKYSHGWLDNNGQSNWERRTVFVQEKNNSVWEATLHIANAQNGEKVLYDIDPIKKVESPIKLGATSTTDSIRQGEENVNTQFSMRVDSEGRELSEAQQEYFEYSEVRNKEGLLIPVYHATDNSFTVFDREKLGAETDKNADDVAFAATAHIGFWFNSNDIKGKTAQNKSLAGYLNIEDPYYVDSIGALAAQIMDNYGEEYGELQERFDGRDYKAAEELGDSFVEWLERKGYDGIIVEDEEFGGTSYVALKSNQFKNADNQNPTENPDIRFSMRHDADYMKAVESGDTETAQRLVDEAAKAAGYDTEPLYHGTQNFGFTKLDVSKSDDKISFFATSNPDIAQTYSGKRGTKKISSARGGINGLTEEEVVDRLNKEAVTDGFGMESKYRIMRPADIKAFFADVDKRIEKLDGIVERKSAEYADRLATDFNHADERAHSQLVRLSEALQYYNYDKMSTPLWVLLNNTDVFNSIEKKRYGNLEADIRLRNGLAEKKGIDEGAVIKESLDRYEIRVKTFEDARNELAANAASGNYVLRGKTKGLLEIDGNGHNWNDIFATLGPKGGNTLRAEYDFSTSSIKLSDKNGEFANIPAKTLSEAEPAMARAITKQYGSYFAATVFAQAKDQLRNSATAEVAVKTTGRTNTRTIAKFAKEQSYRGVKITNIYDNGGRGANADTGNVYIYFYPQEDVKSADAVTYDDKGKVIPLSERFNAKNDDIRYSKRGNFVENKYYSRQIDNLENLKEGSYITVGEIKKDSPLNLVGIPDKRLYFDVSKIRQEMKDRSDPIPSEKIKDIPKVLDNPIVITEYVDKHETHSVNVYGKLYIGSSPVVVGVMISKGRGGNIINKVQTVHPNRNFANEMTADKILYLTPNKKEARQWFQAPHAQMPLLGGNKSGFIRSITQKGNEVKPSVSDLGKVQYQLRVEDKNRLDILDKQETRLTADLKTLEKAYAEAIRAEYERSIKPREETSLRQTPRTDEKPLKLCYNVVYPKERAEIFAKGCGRMEIKALDRETYAGRKFTARYRTNGYYDICADKNGFRIEYVPFSAPEERSFDDEFFGEWLENPVAYGAFEGEKLLGYAEGSLEEWNNRFRLSNICVFDGGARRKGTGTLLMDAITKAAKASGARMMVLETQSCNENAIAFYKKNGFELIGFDLYAYSNTDPERHEVRVEMGKKLI